MIGQRFGSYVALRQVGEGGMGAVFEAVHEQIGRRAAIKVLSPALSQDPQIRARFLNEARAVNIVQHAGLVGIFEIGQTAEGAAFLVMEFLDGDSLRQRLDRLGRLPVPDALRLLRQLALALAAAHGKGIVHRDLKPENVILVPEPEIPGGERAKILDFGIAKVAAEAQVQGAKLTQAGALLGTPAYMSPEQCGAGGTVGDRADVYALGVMLYEVLAGVLPFRGEGLVALLGQQLMATPRPVRELAPSVPPALAVLLERMMAKEPAARPSMTEIARAAELIGSAAPSAPAGFVLAAAPERIERNWLNIDHPQANGRPDAVLLAAARFDPRGRGGAGGHHTGVWYTPGGRWAVYNEDRAPMAGDAAFNVVVAPGGFVHRATTASIVNNWSLLDHPAVNDRPDAVVLVTASWNPPGAAGVYNDHALGVWYTGGRWAVFNQDRAPLPEGACWSVLCPEGAFVHRVTAGNVRGGSATCLSHPAADGNPAAVILVTPSWNPLGQGGVYHDHPIGLYYSGDRWAIVNEDLAPMPLGAAFNVWVCA